MTDADSSGDADPARASDVADLTQLRSGMARWSSTAAVGMQRGRLRQRVRRLGTPPAPTPTCRSSAHLDEVAVGMAWLALVERIPGPERWHASVPVWCQSVLRPARSIATAGDPAPALR